MDPEEMRRSIEAIRNLARVPAEVSLTLQPETVTFAQNAGNLLILTLGAPKEMVTLGEATLLCTARWKKDGIEINLMVQSVKGTLAYNRASS
jgi:hypothetical protein